MTNINITSSDLENHVMSKNLYQHSKYLKNLVISSQEISEEIVSSVPLNNVSSIVLIKIIDFLEKYDNSPFEKIEKPLKSDDLSYCVGTEYLDFLESMEMELLFEVIKAANFLEIESLLDLTCAKVATMLKGKSVEEIRQTFGIENDFTPEEEEEIRKENAWCQDI